MMNMKKKTFNMIFDNIGTLSELKRWLKKGESDGFLSKYKIFGHSPHQPIQPRISRKSNAEIIDFTKTNIPSQTV